MKPYVRLASFYEKDWGKFSLGYLGLLDHISEKQGFHPTTALDIACGTGDLIAALQEKGLKTMGCDLSPKMIAVAKKRHPATEFFVCDMASLNLDRNFDLIICPFDSINYLLDAKLVNETVSRVYRHLNDGGYFVFDINTKNLYENRHHGVIEREVYGEKFRQVLNYNQSTEIASTVFEFADGKKEEHLQKAFSKETVTELLKAHGFHVVDAYRNLRFEPADQSSEKVFLVARKNT